MSDVQIFTCGPSRDTCKCNCPDGPCEHDFQGWQFFDKRGNELSEAEARDHGGSITGSSICTRCDLSAIDHDMWVGP